MSISQNKRSIFLSQFFFFFTLNSLFGTLSFLKTYQMLSPSEILITFYNASSLVVLVFSIILFCHNFMYTYKAKIIFIFIGVFVFLDMFYDYYTSILYFNNIDILQFPYVISSPELTNQLVPKYLFYKKVFIFLKVIVTISLCYFFYKNKYLLLPFSLNIKVQKRQDHFLSKTIKIIMFLIFLALSNLFIAYSLSLKAIPIIFKNFFILKPTQGLFTNVKTYELKKKDKTVTVHLYPTVHIAPEEFYQSYDKTIPKNSVVLMEGVSDKKKLMTYDIQKNYEILAKKINFKVQTLIPSEKVSKEKDIFYLASDIDISLFSKSTLDLLESYFLSITKKNNPLLIESPLLMNFEQDALKLKSFREDILIKRNQIVLDNLKKYSNKYNVFIVPWGAHHMRGIEEGLIKEGYKKTKETEHLYVDSDTINRLIMNLTQEGKKYNDTVDNPQH